MCWPPHRSITGSTRTRFNGPGPITRCGSGSPGTPAEFLALLVSSYTSTITITADHNHSSTETTGANVVVEGTLIAKSATIDVDSTDTNNDTFTITPSGATPITVDGGKGSNRLNFNADGLA